MRKIFTILFFISTNSFATKYYVANAGSDANNGTSSATPFQTVPKINSTATSGDSVLFNDGDLWNAQLKPAASNIYYGSYGTGNMPTITGFQLVTGWTNVTGNIWRAVVSTPVNGLNTVLINGSMAIKGRFPNTGYLTFSSGTKTQLTTSLTGAPNYAGKEIVVRTARWILDVSSVSSQSTGTLNLSSALTYTPNLGGTGFFFQNDSSLVDTTNEYSYNSTTQALIVYSVGSPTVQVSNIDTLVWLSKKNYITFDGLSFTGANKASLQSDTSNHFIIKNCSINYSGTIAISALKSVGDTIQNNNIQNSLSGAIYMRNVDPYTPMVNTCDSATITGNYISKTGIYAGMGLSNNERYFSVFVVGNGSVVSGNTIDSTGYIGIDFGGANVFVKNNYVSNFCFVKDDGGGIYTGIGSYFSTGYNDGGIIRDNIVVNGIGAPAGTNGAIVPTAGIYLDDYARYITVESNSISNCVFTGIELNEPNTCNIYNNTVMNGTGNGIQLDGISPTYVFGFNIKRNIIYSQNISQHCFYRSYTDVSESIDTNYYPNGQLKMLSTAYSLPAWISATGYDTNSAGTPSGIISGQYLFFVNPSMHDSTFTVPSTYIDPKGNYYYGYSNNNTVTLHAFASLILLKSATEYYPSHNISGSQNKMK